MRLLLVKKLTGRPTSVIECLVRVWIFVCEFVCVKLWLETISVLRMGTSVFGRVGRSVGQSVDGGENDKNSL